MKIGVFDSGIGGVTVLREIVKILPNAEYVYYSDSANNPYGDKSDEEIINICDNITKLLIDKKCDAIVVACNTASAKAVKFLREKYTEFPIIAIEPAYKMVHDFAPDDETLVMATRGTIESEKFNLLYHTYDNHKTTLLECVGLADVIEEGNKDKIKDFLNNLLSKYNGKVKNVVLGCTHYPLVQDVIDEVLGGNIKFFNGAPYTAKHLKDVLIEKKIISEEDIDMNQKIDFENIEFIDTKKSEEKRIRFFKNLE